MDKIEILTNSTIINAILFFNTHLENKDLSKLDAVPSIFTDVSSLSEDVQAEMENCISQNISKLFASKDEIDAVYVRYHQVLVLVKKINLTAEINKRKMYPGYMTKKADKYNKLSGYTNGLLLNSSKAEPSVQPDIKLDNATEASSSGDTTDAPTDASEADASATAS